MYQSFYQDHPLLLLPLVAMVAFFVGFTAIVVRTWWRAAPTDERARLPLLDDDTAATLPDRSDP
jgi:hypothetical protein